MSDGKGALNAWAGEFRFVCHTTDFEATVAFYRDGIGLNIIGGWDRAADDRGVLFRAASGIIEVLCSEVHGAAPGGAWILVEVADVDELYRRAEARGLPVKEELNDTHWGHRRFVLTDPNGVNVAFFSYVGEREVKAV